MMSLSSQAGDALILSDLRRRFRQPAARRGVSLCYPLLIASSSASARPSCCKSVIDPAAAAIMVMQLFWVYFKTHCGGKDAALLFRQGAEAVKVLYFIYEHTFIARRHRGKLIRNHVIAFLRAGSGLHSQCERCFMARALSEFDV
jgi:hypothetical protein